MGRRYPLDRSHAPLVRGISCQQPWHRRSDAQQGLQASLARAHQQVLEGEVAMIQGVPLQMIIDTARDKGADLIVMGTHGRTGLMHAPMSSVAE